MVPSERDFIDDYEDYLPVRTRSSALCCRTIAIIVSSHRCTVFQFMKEFLTASSVVVIEQFMTLLVLRHTLPLVVSGDGEYSFALFSVSVMANVVLIRLEVSHAF